MKLKRAALLILFVLLSGCSAGVQPTATPSKSPAVSPSAKPAKPGAAAPSTAPNKTAQTMSVAVYYLKDSGTEFTLVREEHTVPNNEGVARAALNELISGKIMTQGAFRVLPQDTKISSINIENGLATVDFSKEVLKANVGAEAEALGIISIVNTLTEFPTVQKVSFTVEGSASKAKDWWGHVGLSNQPFKRDLSKVYTPAIWVTSPVPGQKIAMTFTLQGSAMIFEATVCYRLKDKYGKILTEGFFMASAGAPERGDFKKVITFTASSPGSGQLEVFEQSMKDGSDINKVIIPVEW